MLIWWDISSSLWQKFLMIVKINSTMTNISSLYFLMKHQPWWNYSCFFCFSFSRSYWKTSQASALSNAKNSSEPAYLLNSIPTVALLIVFLKYSQELYDFCGFDVIPDASKFTRFEQDFLLDLQSMLDHLVDLTEPFCQKTWFCSCIHDHFLCLRYRSMGHWK